MYYSGGSWYRPQSSHAALLDKYWTKVPVGNMPREELKKVGPHSRQGEAPVGPGSPLDRGRSP